MKVSKVTKMHLLRPTKQRIKGYALDFNRRNAKTENAIRVLIEKFPDNKSYEGVLLKSTVINVLYYTQIKAIVPVAEHILKLDIDDDLCRGVPEVVDRIARVTISGKQRINYSFATKYCSFHSPDAYPIYDKYVDKILTEYQKQDGFAQYYRAELKNYGRFKQILGDFRHFYGLADVSLKHLDNFLWGYGKKHFA
jgi:hypothetical protein